MAIAILLVTLLVAGCSLSDRVGDKLNGVPSGYVSVEEHFDPDGFQDYTDYAKYYYENGETTFAHRRHYQMVKETDIVEIQSYFSNFRSWMKAEDRLAEYDFDPACISAGDYWYLEDKEGKRIGDSRYKKYEDYTLRLYDTETDTLFYIHNNI